jgi:dipeptidyl aminopeptidase/acylaminoacyl peptidase
MMRSMWRFAAVVSLLSAFYAGNILAQPNHAGKRFTIEQLMDIKHPSDPVWSPDGRHVAFLWDRAGVTNLYLAGTDGSSKPLQLTSFSGGQLADLFWSHDGQTLYFTHDGGLWQVVSSGGEPQPAWKTQAGEHDFAPSPDGTRVALVRDAAGSQQGADLLLRSLADGTETRAVHDVAGIQQPLWSPDGAHLAYISGAKIIHHDVSPDYSGAKLIYSVEEYQPGQLMVISSAGGTPVAVGTRGRYEALAWMDAGHLVFARESDQYKRRTIYIADSKDRSTRVLHEDVEAKFWSLPDWEAGPEPVPSPDGRWIAYLSDQDGWDHLYVIPSAGGQAVQITKGRFEAWRPAWSHDSTRIAFDANEPDHPGDRRLGIATIAGDPRQAKVEYITSGKGTNIAPLWSQDDRRIVYQHTDPQNSADLFVMDAKPAAQPVRLSDSMPASIDRSSLVAPQFVHFPGADGQMVPGWLFVPKNLDRSKKHPAIVWIHGDGINQNYDGWHVQRNYAVYYSFHQYLLQEGYVVFAPDYRGSIGYGRHWRNGVYMDVGGKDAKDAWMAANYLKTLPYVDSDRIGVWGLSYGGFFTLIAMTDQPTLFRAGVDVAGVVDYVMYYNDPYHGGWTVERMGTPEENPQVYANASPLSHIDRLQRPLLVLHGTADLNVPFIESIRLMDEVLKKNKGSLVSFMVYPGEFHYFTREHVLRDAWRRVDDFFATQLRNEDSESAKSPGCGGAHSAATK